MSREERASAALGLTLFVAFSFLGSWFVAASLRVFEISVTPATLGTRLFTTSLLYTFTMGWQPLVATWVVRRFIDPPDHFDLGLRPARPVFSLVGGLGAILFAMAATLVASWGVALGLGKSHVFNGSAEVELATRAPSPLGVLAILAAFLATIALICLQAFAEEIGWRGYFLPRVMERFGRWRGLVLHGLVWGLWYAPVLFFASYGPLRAAGSLGRAIAFVVTCVLLGIVFGWLRLASQSLAPVVLANTTLTLAAGLPYVVQGVDAGSRSAAFGPAGWLVLAVIIAALLLTKWRHVVQIPKRLAKVPLATSVMGRVWVALERPARGKDGQLLH